MGNHKGLPLPTIYCSGALHAPFLPKTSQEQRQFGHCGLQSRHHGFQFNASGVRTCPSELQTCGSVLQNRGRVMQNLGQGLQNCLRVFRNLGRVFHTRSGVMQNRASVLKNLTPLLVARTSGKPSRSVTYEALSLLALKPVPYPARMPVELFMTAVLSHKFHQLLMTIGRGHLHRR